MQQQHAMIVLIKETLQLTTTNYNNNNFFQMSSNSKNLNSRKRRIDKRNQGIQNKGEERTGTDGCSISVLPIFPFLLPAIQIPTLHPTNQYS